MLGIIYEMITIQEGDEAVIFRITEQKLLTHPPVMVLPYSLVQLSCS